VELNYASYLQLPDLLDLQLPRSEPAEHDEMLFIVIHQTYELWFKQILHEFDKVEKDLSGDDLYGAIHTFKRMRTIVKILVDQMDVLETMTPMSFTSFRDRLDTSSGFQSIQYRIFEFRLGYKREPMIAYFKEDAHGYDDLMRAFEGRTVSDHFYDFLRHRGVRVPRELAERDVREPNGPDEAIQRGILHLYKNQPDIAILLELMTDFDEGIQEWRYRHVKLVERTIGAKKGTGGSLGVEFLKKSLFLSAFPDLWAIRHEL
jgi:tryptophan 2,3-dioxygenase